MFIPKLWRGEYSLAKSYWLFSVLVGAVLGAPISIIQQLPSATLANIWVYGLIYIALYAAYIFIAAVGVWRAATGYTNAVLWKCLAKAHSVLTIVAILGSIAYLLQELGVNGKGSAPSTYTFFKCSNMPAMPNQDCNQVYAGTIQFKVDKERSEVFLIFTDPQTSQQNISKLQKCTVIDSSNWQCGADPIVDLNKDGTGIIQKPYIYRSTNGNVTVSDSTVTGVFNGKTSEPTIIKGGVLKRN